MMMVTMMMIMTTMITKMTMTATLATMTATMMRMMFDLSLFDHLGKDFELRCDPLSSCPCNVDVDLKIGGC